MKIRCGFVSNSSSSSFIIRKSGVDPVLLDKVRNFREYAKDPDRVVALGSYEDACTWGMTEDSEFIRFECWMDNYNLRRYVCMIGVPEDNIINDDY